MTLLALVQQALQLSPRVYFQLFSSLPLFSRKRNIYSLCIVEILHIWRVLNVSLWKLLLFLQKITVEENGKIKSWRIRREKRIFLSSKLIRLNNVLFEEKNNKKLKVDNDISEK